MGVVNVTPDSFSDGGLFLDSGVAVEHGTRLAGEGAAILDIGGGTTRRNPARTEEHTAETPSHSFFSYSVFFF